MKNFLVSVILSDVIEVEEETATEAQAEAVRRALDYPGALMCEVYVCRTKETDEEA
jgi:hypothetical protein